MNLAEQIGNLAGCNVAGRLRNLRGLIEQRRMTDAIHELDHLLAFVEGRDQPSGATETLDHRIWILNHIQQNQEWPEGANKDDVHELIVQGFVHDEHGTIVLTSLGEMEIEDLPTSDSPPTTPP